MTAVEARLLLNDKEYLAIKLKNQGRKRAEIAAEMGVSNSRVSNLIYKAEQKVGKYYQNCGTFYPRFSTVPEQALKKCK